MQWHIATDEIQFCKVSVLSEKIGLTLYFFIQNLYWVFPKESCPWLNMDPNKLKTKTKTKKKRKKEEKRSLEEIFISFLVSENSSALINPLHLNISIHILHTFLYTFPLELTRRIHLIIKASPATNHFLCSHDPNEPFCSIYCKAKLCRWWTLFGHRVK